MSIETDHLRKIVDFIGSDTVRSSFRDVASALQRLKQLETTLDHIRQWADAYGDSLNPGPGSADTFGDGMRAAKNQVRAMLRGGR